MWRYFYFQMRGLFLSGIIGLFFFFSYFSMIPVTDNKEILINRHEIIGLARSSLESQGYSVDDYQVKYRYQSNEMLRWYLTRRFGAEKAKNYLQKYLFGHDGWLLHFLNNQPGQAREEYIVEISPNGVLTSWRHKTRNSTVALAVSRQTAVKIIEKYIHEKQLFNPVEWKLTTDTPQQMRGNTHCISYTYSDSLLKSDWVYEFTVAGNKLEGVSLYFRIPPDAEQEFQVQSSIKKRFQHFASFLNMLIFLWVLFEFVKRGLHREKPSKNRFYLFMFACAVLIGLSFNRIPGDSANWQPGESSIFNGLFFAAIWKIFTEDIVGGIVIFLAFLVGESNYWANRQTHFLLTCEAVFNKKIVTVNVAQSMVRGFFSATTLLGILTLVSLILTYIFQAVFQQTNFTIAFDSFFPWLTPVLTGLKFALTGAVIFLFFLLTSINAYFKNRIFELIAFFLVLFGAGFMKISFLPYYFNFILWFSLGGGFLVIFYKTDLLTTAVALFVFCTLELAYGLLQTQNAFYILSGLSATITGFVPLYIAGLGFKHKGWFHPVDV